MTPRWTKGLLAECIFVFMYMHLCVHTVCACVSICPALPSATLNRISSLENG